MWLALVGVRAIIRSMIYIVYVERDEYLAAAPLRISCNGSIPVRANGLWFPGGGVA